jgi:recombination protein RecR
MLENLISILARLPGLGPRSARRVVLHLLRHREKLLEPLITTLIATRDSIRVCGNCGNLDITDPCPICSDSRRDNSQICVVEEIADLWAIERGRSYKGLYHVLGGTLSALEGRTPDSLNIQSLVGRASQEGVREVILATNATVEGQTTAFYLCDRLIDCNINISRLAHGIPMGGELDYLDDGTLGAALKARLPVA